MTRPTWMKPLSRSSERWSGVLLEARIVARTVDRLKAAKKSVPGSSSLLDEPGTGTGIGRCQGADPNKCCGGSAVSQQLESFADRLARAAIYCCTPGGNGG